MRQRIVPPRVGDMTLLGGWLFADLLLALMVIFFASALGAPPPDVIPPPILIVSPTTPLSPNNSPCTGGTTNATCTITLGESPLSKEEVDWKVSSGFGSQVIFSPASGHLRPGDTTTVSISAIPCQNDAFTFYDNSNRSNKAHAES